MIPDLDPILDADECAYGCRDNFVECERCGALVEETFSVPDCSPMDGYHGRAKVCRDCKDKNEFHCGSCL